MIKRLRLRFGQFREFVLDDLWQLDLAELPRMRRGGYSLLRVVSIVVRGFRQDNCGLHASALTFITLMSMVPMLALMFSVAKGLGAQKKLMSILDNVSADLPEALIQAKDTVLMWVDQANFMTMGVIGLLLMFWTVIKVMGKIENSFNIIWGVRSSRAFSLKFAYYISLLLFVPVVILTVSALNASLASPELVAAVKLRTGPLFIFYRQLLRLTGLVGIVGAFTMLYAFLPNTRVRWSAALVGGICGGLIWLGWQWSCIHVQVWITKYNRIYGAFASLPVSLLWLYVNWMIVLFGAEIAFAYQNYETYSDESDSAHSSFATRKLLAFIIVFEVCQRFKQGLAPWLPTELQQRCRIPIRLIRDVLHNLKGGHVLVETEEGAYVPAHDIASLTLKDVETAMVGDNDPHLQDLAEKLGGPLGSALNQYEDAHLAALAGKSFTELIPENSAPQTG